MGQCRCLCCDTHTSRFYGYLASLLPAHSAFIDFTQALWSGILTQQDNLWPSLAETLGEGGLEMSMTYAAALLAKAGTLASHDGDPKAVATGTLTIGDAGWCLLSSAYLLSLLDPLS